MSKKSNLIVTLIGVAVILAALSFVLSAIFAPRTAAKKALRDCREALAGTEAFSYVSVYNPLDHSGPLLPTEMEARLTEADVIDALRERLLGYMDGAKYGGVKEAESGNWDIRVRFAGEERIDVYLTEEHFYLSQNGRKFIFIPVNADEYTLWRNVWLETMFRAQ